MRVQRTIKWVVSDSDGLAMSGWRSILKTHQGEVRPGFRRMSPGAHILALPWNLPPRLGTILGGVLYAVFCPRLSEAAKMSQDPERDLDKSLQDSSAL